MTWRRWRLQCCRTTRSISPTCPRCTGTHCWLERFGGPWPNYDNHAKPITRAAGYWLRDEKGKVTRAMRHICWDGCMFPNDVMMRPQTWSDVLGTMMKVQDAHGWQA